MYTVKLSVRQIVRLECLVEEKLENYKNLVAGRPNGCPKYWQESIDMYTDLLNLLENAVDSDLYDRVGV